jgi:hypothetical protein
MLDWGGDTHASDCGEESTPFGGSETKTKSRAVAKAPFMAKIIISDENLPQTSKAHSFWLSLSSLTTSAMLGT